MFAADNPQIEALLDASARDEATLAFAVPDEIFGFHVQQATEKLFKALITARGIRHPFTHDLNELRGQLDELSESLPAMPLPLSRLNEYAVTFRYDSGPLISEGLRAEFRSAVTNLRRHVCERIKALAAADAL